MSSIPSREEALFADALAQPPAQRGAFLGQACGTDASLLARIAALLAAHVWFCFLPWAADLRRGATVLRVRILQRRDDRVCHRFPPPRP